MDESKSGVVRGTPQPKSARAALVTRLSAEVREAKAHWNTSYERMICDMDFAYGRQWSTDDDDTNYVANIALRHLQTRTAAIYSKNPTVAAKRRERIDYLAWDGQPTSIISAQEQMKQFEQMKQQYPMVLQQAVASGMDPSMIPPPEPPDEGILAILEDYSRVMDQRKQLDRVAKTLEIVYAYYQDEQATNFKAQMKRVVRRGLTTGVGYVELGFQRTMGRDPDCDREIADMQSQIEAIRAKMADLEDGEITEDEAKAEQLRAAVAGLEAQEEVILREGLVYEFPDSFSIIPDVHCTSLLGFTGCNMVTRQYVLSVDQVKATYQVDVGSAHKGYGDRGNDLVAEGAQRDRQYIQARGSAYESRMPGTDAPGSESRDVVLWRIYHKVDGVVYTIVDGYPDFLEEPAPPDTKIERFYPWFPLVLNEVEHTQEIYPPSDIRLLRPAQMEYNRARQGLREHRIAARPKTVVAADLLTRDDRRKLQQHPANAVIELDGLGEGQKVDDVLQPWNGPGIDPNLYEVNPAFADVQRTVGSSEANLGGTGGGTATENAIAEGSRLSALESNVDDLDSLLSDLAREGGQVLLMQLDKGTATMIAGVGASWPELRRAQIVQEVFLSVRAGSTGRPNKAQDVANFERVAPILQAIPGLSPAWIFDRVVEALGWNVDISEAFDEARPSISAQNAIDIATQTGQAGGQPPQGQTEMADNEPARQGGAGGQNSQVGQSESQVPSAPIGRPPMAPINPRALVGNA